MSQLPTNQMGPEHSVHSVCFLGFSARQDRQRFGLSHRLHDHQRQETGATMHRIT